MTFHCQSPLFDRRCICLLSFLCTTFVPHVVELYHLIRPLNCLSHLRSMHASKFEHHADSFHKNVAVVRECTTKYWLFISLLLRSLHLVLNPPIRFLQSAGVPQPE